MEYRPYYLAREWTRLGHEVTIIGGTFSHLRMLNPKATLDYVPERVDGVSMIWLPAPRYQGNGLGRARNIISFAARLLKASGELARRTKPNVVITSSTHPLDVYGGRRIALLTGAAHVHEVHDLWPLTLVELGGISPWNPFVLLLKLAENHAYSNADRVVSMLPNALPYMERHGLHPARFVYVPNGVAVEDWDQPEPLPTGHIAVLNQLKATSRFLVGYAGGFALSNDLESLVLSLNYLEVADAHVVMVGEGQYRRDLEARHTNDRITFLGPVRKAAVPALLAYFDACFLGYRHSPLYRFGINPNKMFDYMMAAKPIISAVEAANDPVSASGAGLTVRPEDPAAVATAIERLAAEPAATRQQRGEMGRRYVLENHDYRLLAARFLHGLGST
jgi:glycosyltransferase involved in cell wall biosynthesis